MKIYVSHASSFDFRKELYEPIRNSHLNKEHQFILPHETSNSTFNSKEAIPSCDLVIAEVSFPSTGVGIEIGWANKDNKRIVFIYKKGSQLSKSLDEVSSEFLEYDDASDLISKLDSLLSC